MNRLPSFPHITTTAFLFNPDSYFSLKGETKIVLMDIKFYIHAKQAVASVLHIIFY